MPTMTIAFDESGNTGQNLLDAEQPYFALASVNFKESEIAELCSLFESSADELHFKNLKKYPKSKKQLIQFCNHKYISSSRVKTYVANKEIALIGHIVDRIIEPIMYNIGKDIYKDRSNIIFTNLIYIFGQKSWNREIFLRLYKSFQDFIRNPSEITIESFYSINQTLIDSIEDKAIKDLLIIIDNSKNIKKEIISTIEPYIIDLTFPTFNVLADSWYNELNSEFEIIHDNGKAIEFWQDMIAMLSDPNKMEAKEVGFGTNKMSYPLKFTKLDLVDSKDYKQVQIADLIASALCFGLKHENNIGSDNFIRELWSSKLFNIFHHSMRELDEATLKSFIEEGDQEGTNPLDYLAEMFYKNDERNKHYCK